MTRSTIFALSSGHGRAGIAVLRLSGPDVPAILVAMIGKLPEPRRAVLARFKDPVSGETLDRGLALFFPGPASETGEDCAEFHCHGSPAVVAAMLRVFGSFEAARLAEPGEFVRRAFANDKLDLTEVEGLADLVEAETEAQRRQALRQAEGGLSGKAEDWRRKLLTAAALLEAEIDFAEEADVATATRQDVEAIVAALATDFARELAAAQAGERLRGGLTAVIAGPPNAGKSTLLNALARRDAAIVSAVPGTTRDTIEIHLDLDGLPLTVIDTAGLHEGTGDPVEATGMKRAREKAAAADLILWLSEAGAPVLPNISADAEIWPIFTKSDLGEAGPLTPNGLRLSAVTGANMDELRARLTEFAKKATAGGEGALVTRARHRQALMSALAALERAKSEAALGPELLAEDLRCAIRALESLLGRIDVEDVLGEIFSRFCIGK